jgi:hypothetical protein
MTFAYLNFSLIDFRKVLRSRSRKETHHFGKAGAEAVTRGGSRSDGSGSKYDIHNRRFLEMSQYATVS